MLYLGSIWGMEKGVFDMQTAISNLPFMGFRDAAFIELALRYNYDIEIFYEFGTDYYWDSLLQPLQTNTSKISVHAPCVSVNLADIEDKNWFKTYRDTILFAQRHKAEFVVLHTNEAWQGDRRFTQQLVEERLLQIVTFAQDKNVPILIENVGLVCKNNLLYDFAEYCALLERFPTCGSLIDTGHAYVNGWDIAGVVAKLGTRIKALHLHDNDGYGDTHLCIGEGSIGWDSCLEAVKQHAPQAKLVLEYSCMSAQAFPQHLDDLCSKYGI